jgi:hypothetical protein
MGSVGAQHHRTDGEGRSRLNDRLPAGSALGRRWSAATELGADFPVHWKNIGKLFDSGLVMARSTWHLQIDGKGDGLSDARR